MTFLCLAGEGETPQTVLKCAQMLLDYNYGDNHTSICSPHNELEVLVVCVITTGWLISAVCLYVDEA